MQVLLRRSVYEEAKVNASMLVAVGLAEALGGGAKLTGLFHAFGFGMVGQGFETLSRKCGRYSVGRGKRKL